MLKDTDQPSGSGGFKSKGTNGSGNRHRSLFSLTTFTREDDLDRHGQDSEAAYAGRSHFDRSAPEKSVWGTVRSADNESEEELTRMGQQRNKGLSGGGDSQRIVKVTTFQVRENRI